MEGVSELPKIVKKEYLLGDHLNPAPFILKKLISQIKYEKILDFEDRNPDQFFALNNLMQSNVYFFT